MKPIFLIIESRYYEDISNYLLEGAIKSFKEHNYNFEKITVLGALEIPVAMSMAIKLKKYSGLVGLGCVIRGKTFHFEIVSKTSANAIMNIGINHSIPVGNGILTVENKSQALIRADVNKKNVGGHAALAMIRLFESFKNSD